MEFFIKMIQSIALVSGFLIVNIVLLGIFMAIVWWFLKSAVNLKSAECKDASVGVEIEAKDWLLSIVKFGAMTLCFISVPFIAQFVWDKYEVLCLKLGIRAESTFEMFVLGISFMFFVVIGIVASIGWVKIIAKESAVERKM